eukprot:TRINITY_DN1012_c0_g1_i1.p1 TRINITY_DN1012_c0_g1~~TRINITY_DN1012_c0_g1_i1.p1  ORF type:complete len:229 (-),score=65.75 TRINITY_DN1012_c0_g1_i1:890-1576(-)
MANLDQWWESMGKITKFLFVAIMAVTLATNFGFLIQLNVIHLDFGLVWNKFQIWRLFTNFLFGGKLGFPFLMHMFMFVSYSQILETTRFQEQADYAWLLTVIASALLIPGYLMDVPFLGTSLMYAIIYIFSRYFPHDIVKFWFGFQFEAQYLPWALAAFSMLMGGVPIPHLMGIAAGHVFFYFKEVYPAVSGRRFMDTPEFMFDLLPGDAVQPRSTLRAFQGQGHRLQ